MESVVESKLLLSDDFKDGFDLSRTWALLSFESFVADDGGVTASPAGLRVAASANASTGRPAFALEETEPNEFDHTKWMADTQHVSSNAYPGFDAVPGSVLSCTMRVHGETFGTGEHPYGSAVSDPESDLRLAAFAMNTIDWETGMVFDVWMSNTAIYPYYERLNLAAGSYQTFSSCFPGVPRSKDDEHVVSVAYNPSAGVVRWVIDGTVAAEVDKIGFPSSQATMLIDRGGTPQLAAPRQLNCGMALFTLMDGGLPPTGQGLVSLGGSYVFPTSFVGGPAVFGQGVEMRVRNFEVAMSV
jgi:hypothetical protein